VEGEYILLYLPETREVNVEVYDPALSNYGIRIEEKNGVECLVATQKSGNDDIYIPLGDLLKGGSVNKPEELPAVTQQEPADERKAMYSGLNPLLVLKVGTNENEIGQGMADKQLEGGRFIYAVPSFAVYHNNLYIVDAINFRVLIYDNSGVYIRKIGYPQTGADGKTISMRDISVDNDFIYLVSGYENSVYVVDAETEDIATIISETGNSNEKFGAVDLIAIDKSGDLLIADTGDNTLYTFKRDNFTFTLKKSEKYTGSGQLAANSTGNTYSVTFSGSSFTLTESTGRTAGIFTDSLNISGANVIATDLSGNIYVSIKEGDPMAQFDNAASIRVVSPEGTLQYKLPVVPWPGGPMTRYIVVDNEGSVFEAFFTGSELEDSPPTDFIIRKLK
jgi:hypothetical protein